jgi:hypothetical protein
MKAERKGKPFKHLCRARTTTAADDSRASQLNASTKGTMNGH